MEAVRGHAGSVETARELAGEHDVGELGLAVAREAAAFPRTLGVEVVERDELSLVRIRRRRDDASGSGCLEPVEQQRGQQERREVVERPGALDAVDGELALS